MTIDLSRLQHDLDTATPRRTPPWTDGISPVDLRRLEEHLHDRAQFRRLISERPLGAGRGK